MSNTFHLKINTPFNICFDDDITQVELCTDKGYTGILPNHIPIIGMIVPGVITIHTKNNGLKKGNSGYGLFYFYDNKLFINTDTFIFGNETNKDNHQDILKVLETFKLDEKTRNRFEVYLKKTFSDLKNQH